LVVNKQLSLMKITLKSIPGTNQYYSMRVVSWSRKQRKLELTTKQRLLITSQPCYPLRHLNIIIIKL